MSADGGVQHCFEGWTDAELRWIAQSLQWFLDLAAPPTVAQSDPDRSALEISRGLANSHRDEMRQQLAEMHRLQSRSRELIQEVENQGDRKSRSKIREMQSAAEQRDAEISEKAAALARANIDLIHAELGLIDFEVWRPGELVRYRHVAVSEPTMFWSSVAGGLGYGALFLIVVPLVIPILGSLVVIPLDMLGARRLHLVVADLMGFGNGLIAWILTWTLFASAWIYLNLDAAFAPRETVWDWRRRSLRIRGRREEKSHSFQEIRRINIREVLELGAKQHKIIYRMEAQLPGTNLLLFEADEPAPTDDAAQPPPVAEQLEVLALVLTQQLGISTNTADPVADRFTVAGYPRDARLTDLFRIGSLVSGRTRLFVLALCAAILTFWAFRFIQSYEAHAELRAATRATGDRLWASADKTARTEPRPSDTEPKSLASRGQRLGRVTSGVCHVSGSRRLRPSMSRPDADASGSGTIWN